MSESDKKKEAKKALRQLHSKLIKYVDPNIKEEFFAVELITHHENQRIDAEKTDNDKNKTLLNFLQKRNQEDKILDKFIEVLKENENANSYLLQKIKEVYSYYPVDTNQTPKDEPIPRGPSTSQGAQLHQLLPDLNIGCDSQKSKDVSVDFPKTVFRESTDGKGKFKDSYTIDSSPRGYCVIINNENFTNMRARAGSQWDAEALAKLFEQHLGFFIQSFKDLTSVEMKRLMRNISEQDHSKLNCLVVCILSHGVNGQIYGADGELVKVEEITRAFVGTKCPSLVGKPKVFLLQACRGGSFDHGVKMEQSDDGVQERVIDEKLVLAEDETDGGNYEKALPDESDFVLAYATTPGYVSWRNSAFGTWFIKAFTDTMYERASNDHLMDILTEVNRKVAEEYESREFKKQMPAPVTMLRYKLFLPPVGKQL